MRIIIKLLLMKNSRLFQDKYVASLYHIEEKSKEELKIRATVPNATYIEEVFEEDEKSVRPCEYTMDPSDISISRIF